MRASTVRCGYASYAVVAYSTFHFEFVTHNVDAQTLRRVSCGRRGYIRHRPPRGRRRMHNNDSKRMGFDVSYLCHNKSVCELCVFAAHSIRATQILKKITKRYMQRLRQVMDRMRSSDPCASLMVPCKYHPRCAPRSDAPCRFCHVSDDVRKEFFIAQELAAIEQSETRDFNAHRVKLLKTHHELLSEPYTKTWCIAVSFTYADRVHGTEYVYPPRGCFRTCDAFDDSCERYVGQLVHRFPKLRVYGVRIASVSRDSADSGHPVRTHFYVPFFVPAET